MFTFLPVYQIWHEKTLLDSKFVSSTDNVFHRLNQVLHLIVLGFIIWNIQQSGAAFDASPCNLIFTGGILFDAIWFVTLYADIWKNGVGGGPEAKHDAVAQMKRKLVSGSCYMMAFLWCLYDYYNNGGGNGGHTTSTPSTLSSTLDDDNGTNFMPAYLVIAGFILEFWVYTPLTRFVIMPRHGYSREDVTVPSNKEFIIERIGEFIMLLMGESVLSIIAETGEYNWSSSTFDRRHPIRNSRQGFLPYLAWCWITIFSASLILIGSAFKMVMAPEEMLEKHPNQSPESIARTTATIFAVNQTTAFVMIDLMLWAHRGWSKSALLFRRGGKWALRAILAQCLNLALLLLTLALSRILDMTLLAVLGCLLVFLQLSLRIICHYQFPVTMTEEDNAGFSKDEGDEDESWPN
ncbi:MAG: hypothetical protein SGARI_005841, partial [Bacillariaceae sp.]